METTQNIMKTYNGTEYAIEKEGPHCVEYLAHCIEAGEMFYSSFYAPLTYTKEQLFDIGYELALDWGGECFEILRVMKRYDNGSARIQKVY